MIASKSQCMITGVYRSGTEYVAQLLSGHPALSSTMYHVNAYRFIRGRYEPLCSVENARRAVADTADRLKARYDISLDQQQALERFRLAPHKNCEAIYDAIVSALWIRGNRIHWAEKCQLVWREIPDFIAGMSNGRAILVIRDPRSTLASFKEYTYAPPPAYLGAVFNCFDAFKSALHYQSILPVDRYLTVRYEDVVRAPRLWLENLLAFLNLDIGEAFLDRSSWKNERGDDWQDNTAFASEFKIDDAIHRWQGRLSDAEIALTEMVCGDAMTALGYTLSGKSVAWPQVEAMWKEDRHVMEYVRLWREMGQGIEAFPTDPLDPSNWQESRTGAGVRRAG